MEPIPTPSNVEKTSPGAGEPEEIEQPGQTEPSAEAEPEPSAQMQPPALFEDPAARPDLAAAAPVTRRPVFYRFLNWLLGKDSAMGRFMRPALRVLSVVIGLLALGVLAAFFFLYQPTQNRLDLTQNQLNAAQGEIRQRETTIQGLQGQMKARQDQLDAANQQAKALTEDLKTASNRNNLLVVINDIATARMYLALKDGAQTMKVLEQAKTDLALTLPFLLEKNKTAADEVKSRLDLMTSVLVRDSALAQSDLDNLYTALLAIQISLFGE
jgi:hypothetical protein